VLTASRRVLESCLILLLISLGTFFFRLGALPFVGADEPRYARIAQEMQEAGRWVTPTLEHRPWLEKPPLYYWITIPFYSAFGVSETTARIGTAVFALIMTGSVFWLGIHLWGRRAGFYSAAALMTSMGVVAYGRSASTDMPLTACLTGTLAILCSSIRESRMVAWKVFAGYAALGLAILGKGPVALLLAGGVAIAFWCLDEQGGSMRRWRVVAGLLITAAVALPWFWLAFRENGFAFIAIFLLNHNIARFVSDIHHHTEPFYYFLPILPGLMFPWCAWLILLIPDSLRRWREWDRETLFLACWVLVPLIFFSASKSKLPGYVLPCMPPAALLLGARISRWVEQSQRPKWHGTAACVHLALAAIIALAFPMVMKKYYGGGVAGALLVSALCVLPAYGAFRFLRSGRPAGAFAVTAAQGVALSQVAFPAIGRYASAKEIAQQMSAVRDAGEPAVTFRFFHHALHYYTGYAVTEDFVDILALDDFARSHPVFLVVVEDEHLPELSGLRDFSITNLGSQGKLRLVRLTQK